MSDQLIAEVHAMLSAQFKAAGMITIIDGYTLFQNSEAGPYVGLYNTRRNHREGRVYVNSFDGNGHSIEFRKLPKWLQDVVIQSLAKEQPSEAPRSEGREYVEQKNYLRRCQPFKVIRYKYASADENEKEPWRIERCFDIGRPQPLPQPMPPAKQPEPAPGPEQKQVPEPANDPERDGIVAELWNLAPTVYRKWDQEIRKIVSGVSMGRTDELKMLDKDELHRLRALILLDKLGLSVYRQDWYSILSEMVAEADYDSVYEMSVAGLRDLYKSVKDTSEMQPA